MKKDKQNVKHFWGWYVVVGVVLVFAFFAPIIFTSHGKIDFLTTGPIGDTIGGIMGPFVALAGVIVTFLAFIIQKNANDILVSQHEADIARDKTERLNTINNRVKLFFTDIKLAETDLGERIEKLEEYLSNLDSNLFAKQRLLLPSNDLYRRMSNANRENFFEALTTLEQQDPIDLLKEYYGVSDHMLSSTDDIALDCNQFSENAQLRLKEILRIISKLRFHFKNYRPIGLVSDIPTYMIDFLEGTESFDRDDVGSIDMDHLKIVFQSLSEEMDGRQSFEGVSLRSDCDTSRTHIKNTELEGSLLIERLRSEIIRLGEIEQACGAVLKKDPLGCYRDFGER